MFMKEGGSKSLSRELAPPSPPLNDGPTIIEVHELLYQFTDTFSLFKQLHYHNRN